MSNVVWSADKGWHDGPAVNVGADARGRIVSTPRALNDPVVDCCGRDAADCDCVRYVATINVPGYLPLDDEPPTFETVRAAWEYLIGELERNDDYGVSAAWVPADEDDPDGPQDRSQTALDLERAAELGLLGTVYGDTPGYDGEWDLGLAYSVQLAEPVD